MQTWNFPLLPFASNILVILQQNKWILITYNILQLEWKKVQFWKTSSELEWSRVVWNSNKICDLGNLKFNFETGHTHGTG